MAKPRPPRVTVRACSSERVCVRFRAHSVHLFATCVRVRVCVCVCVALRKRDEIREGGLWLNQTILTCGSGEMAFSKHSWFS